MKQMYITKLIVTLTLLLSIMTVVHSQTIRDAFVLVDVSGSMNSSITNDEAKQQILDMLSGHYNPSVWKNKGWKVVVNSECKPFSTTTPIIGEGSFLCIMPFGNMETIMRRTTVRVDGNSSLEFFFRDNYPTVFNEAFTYLELAKAYVGSVAQTSNVGNGYIFIYSDGMGDYVKDGNYPPLYQKMIDNLGLAGSDSFEKIGILRKAVAKQKFNIEVWRFKSFSTIKDPKGPKIGSKSKAIAPVLKITSPKTEHCKVDIDKPLTIKWTGTSAADVIILRKDGVYKPIVSKDRKDYYNIQKSRNNAKIEFHKAGDYQVKVVKGRASDTLSVEVASDFYGSLLLILLMFAIIGVGFWVYNKFFNSSNSGIKEPEWGNDNNNKTRKPLSTNDDWNL